MISRFKSWLVIGHCGRLVNCTLEYGFFKKNLEDDEMKNTKQ